MLSSRRRAVEVFVGSGWRATTFKRRKCMKRQASSVWPSLKNGPRVTQMWSSAKRYQVREIKSQNSRGSMSALGHKRTFALQWVMSALPPKGDMCGAAKDVRFGPIADIL